MHVVDKILSVDVDGQIKALVVHRLTWTGNIAVLRLVQSFDDECEYFTVYRAQVRRHDGTVVTMTDATERTVDGPGRLKTLVYEAMLSPADCGVNVAFRGSSAAKMPEGEFEWKEVPSAGIPGGLRSLTIITDAKRTLRFDAESWSYRLARYDGLSVHRWRCTEITHAPLFVSTIQSYADAVRMISLEWSVDSVPSELAVVCKRIFNKYPDSLTRLKAAFTWVHENIVEIQSTLISNKGRSTLLSQVIETRNGDASQRLLVLKTMLGELSVVCEPVLVSSGLDPAQFPRNAVALSAFDRLMAFCPELNVYIVPQLGPDAIGFIPSQYYNRRILHLSHRQNVPEWLTQLPVKNNHYYVEVIAQLKSDGSVEGTSRVGANGSTLADLILATRRCEGDTGKLIAKLALWSSGQPGYGQLNRCKNSSELVVEGQFHIYPSAKPLFSLLTNIGLRVSEPSGLKALRGGSLEEKRRHLPTSFHEKVNLIWNDEKVQLGHQWQHDIAVGNSFLSTRLYWGEGAIELDRKGIVYSEDIAAIGAQICFPRDLPALPAPIAVNLYYHRTCGLAFVSPVPIPVFERLDDVPYEPIQIGFGDVGSNFQDLNAAVVGKMMIQGDVIEVAHSRLGRARINGKDQVLLDPLDGPESQDAAALLSGPILTILLNQRGIHAFHASCIQRYGKAIAFCGTSGRGKSTMVASFVANGWMPVSDDILATDLSGYVPKVWPGPRQSWLIEDSVNAFFTHVTKIPRRSIDGKAFADYRDIWCSKPVELGDLIIIDEPSADGLISMCRIDNDSAVEELLMQLRLPQYQVELAGEVALRDTCIALARSLRVWRLCRPFDYSRITEIVRYIETTTGATAHSKQLDTRTRCVDSTYHANKPMS